jgi:hypothetical protein
MVTKKFDITLSQVLTSISDILNISCTYEQANRARFSSVLVFVAFILVFLKVSQRPADRDIRQAIPEMVYTVGKFIGAGSFGKSLHGRSR